MADYVTSGLELKQLEPAAGGGASSAVTKHVMWAYRGRGSNIAHIFVVTGPDPARR